MRKPNGKRHKWAMNSGGKHDGEFAIYPCSDCPCEMGVRHQGGSSFYRFRKGPTNGWGTKRPPCGEAVKV